MSIQDLIDSHAIQLSATFDPIWQAVIQAELETLYASPLARLVFDQLTPESALNINAISDDTIPGHPTGDHSYVGQREIFIDPSHTLYYIDENGTVVDHQLAGIIMHEAVHAIAGLEDTKFIPIDGTKPNPDYEGYMGLTVIYISLKMNQLGFTNRLSYSDADVNGDGTDFLTLGQNFTFGNTIDLCLFASSDTLDGDNFFPRPSPTTALNTRLVRDLIICGSGESTIATGLGNDFIYGGGGTDSVYGGAGNDYVDAGIGLDQIRYGNFSGDASGAATQGISLSWSDTAVNVVDPWGGSDTLVNVERLGLALFDDYVRISGDFDQMYYTMTRGVGLSEIDDKSGSEVVGDTLDLNTTEGIYVDLIDGTFGNKGVGVTILTLKM